MKKKTKQVPVPVKEKNKFKDKFFAYLLAGCMIFWTIASVLGIVGFANSIEKEKAVESSTAVAVSADNVHQVRDKKGARQVKDKQRSFNATYTQFEFKLPFWDSLYFSCNGSAYCGFASSCYLTSQDRNRSLSIDSFSVDLMYNAPTLDNPARTTAVYLQQEEAISMNLIIYTVGDVPAIESTSYYPYSVGISTVGYDLMAGGVCFRFDVTEKAYVGNLPDVVWSFFIDTSDIEYADGIFILGDGGILDVDDNPVSYIEGISYEYFFNNKGVDYESTFQAGMEYGRNEGYQSGLEAGQSLGYNRGYSEGIESANQYTFRRLITAVIDTPVQVFTDLFNFEILGVNLTGFFLGLFSIALCLGVIKLIF